ncbi:MAG TPA: RluA family pseudouridine synthase [Blastocatellia bacterium]|nr:RluA family pseudouridine synthase [Blastocatellia bacterium]
MTSGSIILSVAAERHFHFRITPEESGRRLDAFLASRLGSLSRMRLADLLEKGACLVNQTAAAAGYHVASGDLIEVTFDHSTPTAMSPEPIDLEIIHEDPHLLVVMKPAGMLVHPTRGVKTGTLANALAWHLNRSHLESGGRPIDPQDDHFSNLLDAPSVIRPGLVHRLDRATSGLMVIAKTQRALTILSRHFHRRLVEKRYLALLQGNVTEDSFEIVAPIGRDADQRPRWRVMENGRHAHTRIEVRRRNREVTLVELEPVTGRTNQLRIHCATVGHPVVGDDLYGDCAVNGRDATPLPEGSNPVGDPGTSYSRLCLHAWRLAFHHPVGGAWMEFTSAIPSDWPETTD